MSRLAVCLHAHSWLVDDDVLRKVESLVCPYCGARLRLKTKSRKAPPRMGRSDPESTVEIEFAGESDATERLDEADQPRAAVTEAINKTVPVRLASPIAAEKQESRSEDEGHDPDQPDGDRPNEDNPASTDRAVEQSLESVELSTERTSILTPSSDEQASPEDTDDADDELIVSDIDEALAHTIEFADTARGPASESNNDLETQDLPDDLADESCELDTDDSDDGMTRDLGTGNAKGSRDARPADGHELVVPPTIEGYEIIRELGRGGMGIVYLALEVKLQREVALKTLLRVDPAELSRFKDEFRTLADVSHPNLITLYFRFGDEDIHYFTMEVVDGVKFNEYVWSGFEMFDDDDQAVVQRRQCRDEDTLALLAGDTRLTAERMSRLRQALLDLTKGLSVMHGKRILHRDIKPSNIMVTREERLVLLDFGLAVPIKKSGEEDPKDQTTYGTVMYVSPEQASGRDDLGPSSDWYSVGVMLYEMLTGSPPFTGDPLKVLVAKQNQRPREPRHLNPTVPDDWNDVCMDLLHPIPEERPHATDVLRRLGYSEDEIKQVESDDVLPRSVSLVGREEHLADLRSSYEAVLDGRTLSVFVRGSSGMGKSVLIQHFLEDITRQVPEDSPGAAHGNPSNNRAVVLRGRCYEQESVPFKALDSLIDSLGDYLLGLPRDTARSFMPVDILALTKVFPVLGQLERITDEVQPSIEKAEQQELRQRAMIALRETLQLIGSSAPLVLYIDDLQWGDEDSAAMLADLVRPPDPPRMLLLGSYRSENAHESLFLQALNDAYRRGKPTPERRELTVGSLEPDDASRLARLMLGNLNDEEAALANLIARESGGSPFFVWELVQNFRSDPESTRRLLTSEANALDEVIWSRVQRLPEATRRLLEVISVVGQPLTQHEAFQAVGATATGPGLLNELRTKHFVRSSGADYEDDVETYHDRIRESVVAHLEVPVRRDYHRCLAETFHRSSAIELAAVEAHLNRTAAFDEPKGSLDLSRADWQRAFDIAFHFDAAGEAVRALPFALIAAEQARQQHSLEVAEQQYRIALHGAEQSPAALQFRILEGLGDVLMLRGSYEAAGQQFAAARKLAEGKLAIARLEARLGELAFKRGDMEKAAGHIELALKQLGRKAAPKSTLLLMPKVAFEGISQLLHTCFPKHFANRRSIEGQPADRMVIRLYTRLAYCYWFSSGKFPTLWAHLRGMNIGETYEPTLELAHAYSLHGPVMSTVPLYGRAIDYSQRSLEIRESQKDLWGQGQSLHFLGVVLFAASRFPQCIETCRRAMRLLERTGDPWEANMARYHVADALYRMGKLSEAVKEARSVYQAAAEIGDAQAMGVILIVWAAASRGRIPPDVIELELGRPRHDELASLQVLQAKGMYLTLNGSPEQAAEVFQQAIRRIRKRGLQNTYVVDSFTWRATALRMASEACRDTDRNRSRQLIRRAHRAARRSLRLARMFKNGLPHALRELALCAAARSRRRAARRYFDRSLQVAEEQGAAFELALTRLARSQAAEKFDWPGAAAERQTAEAELAAFETADPANF